MNCNRARQSLARVVGEDCLPLSEAPDILTQVQDHLLKCTGCQRFEESLRENQALMRSFRQDIVSEEALGSVRKNLFGQLDRARAELPWWIRLERFLIGEFRRPRFVTAGVAIIIASLTLFAQLRYVSANRNVERVNVADSRSLDRLRDYKEWTVVGNSLEWAQERDPHLDRMQVRNVQRSVFMSPGAYRDFMASGVFPEGTLLVLESRSADSAQDGSGSVMTLSASVKDRRYPGGWEYFRVEGGVGDSIEKAQPVGETDGCRACHAGGGETDHVFTQFYPVLRSASGVL